GTNPGPLGLHGILSSQRPHKAVTNLALVVHGGTPDSLELEASLPGHLGARPVDIGSIHLARPSHSNTPLLESERTDCSHSLGRITIAAVLRSRPIPNSGPQVLPDRHLQVNHANELSTREDRPDRLIVLPQGLSVAEELGRMLLCVTMRDRRPLLYLGIVADPRHLGDKLGGRDLKAKTIGRQS